MFKLNVVMSQKHKSLVAAVQEANEAAESAVENFNAEVSTMFKSDVAPEIEKLNEAIQELRDFCQDISDQATESYDEQSDEWTDGPEGEKYSEWLQTWDAGTGIYDVEIDEPQEMTFEGVDFYGVDEAKDSP